MLGRLMKISHLFCVSASLLLGACSTPAIYSAPASSGDGFYAATGQITTTREAEGDEERKIDHARRLGRYFLPVSTVGFDLTRAKDTDPWAISLVHEPIPDPDAAFDIWYVSSGVAYDTLHIEINDGLLGSAALETDARLSETAGEIAELLGQLGALTLVPAPAVVRYELARTRTSFTLREIQAGDGFAVIGRRVLHTPAVAAVTEQRDARGRVTRAAEAAQPARNQPSGYLFGMLISPDITVGARDTDAMPARAEAALFHPEVTPVEFQLYVMTCPTLVGPSIDAAGAKPEEMDKIGFDDTAVDLAGCVRVLPTLLPIAQPRQVFAVVDPATTFSVAFPRGFGSDDRTSATFSRGLLTRVEVENQGAVIDAIRFLPTALGFGRDDDASGAEGASDGGGEAE